MNAQAQIPRIVRELGGLTGLTMAALRALSTRAHITPVSFTNEYHWGDFKGDPDKLMERFFDAHVYVANWMTAIFMVRLPLAVLAKETAEAMTVRYVLDFKATKSQKKPRRLKRSGTKRKNANRSSGRSSAVRNMRHT